MAKAPGRGPIAAPSARKSRRERRYAWFAGLLVVMLSAGAIWAFMLYSRNVERAADAGTRAAQAAQEKSASLRSGVIVLRKENDTLCEKRQIDNASGAIYGRERVSCDANGGAPEERPQSKYSPGARLDAVKSAFQPKAR
jgi:hypothetical protein